MRLARTTILLAALTVAGAAPAAASAARYVAPGGSDGSNGCADQATPCATIRHAVEQASDGETVLLAAGTYAEAVTLGGGKSLRGTGATRAVIDGGADPAVEVPPGQSAGTIDGTVMRSAATALELRGPATVSNNSFDSAAATAPQVRLLAGAGGSTVAGNAFSDPTATDYQVGLQINGVSSATTVSANTFSGLGTAIVVESSRPRLTGNTITGTHGLGGLSGVGILVHDDAVPDVFSTVIRDPGMGPAIGIYVAEDLSTVQDTGADVEQSRIIGHDPGILIDDSTGVVRLGSDLIAGSPQQGLVLRDTAPTATGEGDVTARNLTVWGGSSAADIAVQDADLQLDSSIVGPGGITSAGGNCAITYSRGPDRGEGGCDHFATTANPGFAGSGAGGFHLVAGSAMIDAGNPSSPAVGSRDFDGDGRALDGDGDCQVRRDIGADERDPGAACASGAETPPAYKTRVLRHRGRDFDLKLIGQHGGDYTLCVRAPHRIDNRRVLCRGGELERTAPGRFVDIVRWGSSFRFMGPGHYRVSWYEPSTRKILGPRKPFETGVCPPQPQLMDGVWKPRPRLRILDSCHTITGTVRSKPYNSRHDGDLPFHFSGVGNVEFLARDRGHLRKGFGGRGPRNPRVGERIRLVGVKVCDGFHGPMGHTEIHPVFKVEYLGKDITLISGPQYGGTPNVHLRPNGFHPCP